MKSVIHATNGTAYASVCVFEAARTVGVIEDCHWPSHAAGGYEVQSRWETLKYRTSKALDKIVVEGLHSCRGATSQMICVGGCVHGVIMHYFHLLKSIFGKQTLVEAVSANLEQRPLCWACKSCHGIGAQHAFFLWESWGRCQNHSLSGS